MGRVISRSAGAQGLARDRKARATLASPPAAPGLPHPRVAPKTLVEEVATRLRQAIFCGELKPGHRLIESELCAAFGVSRPALREALRILQAEKLCETTPHRGAQIPILTWKDAEDIYHVRAMLEGEAAALAAIHSTPDDVDELRRALSKFGEAVHVHDPYRRVEATSQFYSQILRSSRNAVIEEMLLGLLARVNFLRARSMSLSGRAWQSYLEIGAIFEAVENGRPGAAREAAVQHVLNAREAAGIAYGKDLDDGSPSPPDRGGPEANARGMAARSAVNLPSRGHRP